MIKLKSINKKTDSILCMEYDVLHNNGSTTLEESMTVEAYSPNTFADPKVVCSLFIKDCEATDSEEAFDKMAEWCERMAKSLRDRDKPIKVFI
jgi:hypothetical protein